MRRSATGVRHVRRLILLVSPALFAGCAGTPEIPPETQAIRDYIEVGELQEVDSIRTRPSDSWAAATSYFVLYESHDGPVLLEFSHLCREMHDRSMVTPDRRYDHNIMRSRVDTLRGCRISKMYPLTEAQALEIEALANPGGP